MLLRQTRGTLRWIGLNVNKRILNWVLNVTGSQWSCKIWVMWQNEAILVIMRVAEFWTSLSLRINLWGRPIRRELQQSIWEITRLDGECRESDGRSQLILQRWKCADRIKCQGSLLFVFQRNVIMLVCVEVMAGTSLALQLTFFLREIIQLSLWWYPESVLLTVLVLCQLPCLNVTVI